MRTGKFTGDFIGIQTHDLSDVGAVLLPTEQSEAKQLRAGQLVGFMFSLKGMLNERNVCEVWFRSETKR